MPHYTLMTSQQLGLELKAARKARKLTQSDLAARLGLSQSRISHLELHAEELSIEQVMAWCAVVGLELAIGTRGAAAAIADTPAEW